MMETVRVSLSDGRTLVLEVESGTTDQEIEQFITSQDGMSEPSEPTSSGLGFANRAIADTFGAPVDLVSYGMKSLGLMDDDVVPFLGSESLKQGMGAINAEVAPEDAQPQTMAQRGGRLLGEAASFALPMAKGAQMLSAGKTALAPAAGQISQFIAQHPVKAAAAEGLAIGGGALGGQIAADTGAGEVGQAAGEIIGGIAMPLGAAVTPTAIAKRGAGGIINKFSRSDRLGRIVENPEDALAGLREETITDLSVAQRTGDKGIIALERTLAKNNPALAKQFEQRDAENMEKLVQSLGADKGNIAATRDYLQGRSDDLLKTLDYRVQKAVTNAEDKLATVTPNMRQSEASTIVYGELDKAYRDAVATEGKLWRSIPNAAMSPARTKKAYREILKSTPRAQMDDIPDIARKLLAPANQGGMSGFENVRELQGLRSKLLEESRIARASGQRNKARIADELADNILDDLGAKAESAQGKTGEALRRALDYSAGLNKTYRQGDIGTVLGTNRLGGERVAPELTLNKLISSGGIRGDINIDDMLEAADSPQTRQGMQDFLLNQFQTKATRDGQINVRAAEKFINDNADIMTRFPDMQDAIKQAAKAQTSRAMAEGRTRSITSALTKKKQSQTALILEAPVNKEIKSILSSQNPKESASAVMNLVRRSPEAVEGLKSGVAEHLINKSLVGSPDGFGKRMISGNKLLEALRTKGELSAYKEIIGNDGVSALAKIGRELSKIEKAKSPATLDAILNDAPNMLLNNVATTMGARFGAKLGAGTSGASLKTASLMSNQANKIMRHLTNNHAEDLLIQAVQDPQLMEALLTNIKTTSGQKKAAQKLNAWMMGPGLRIIESDSPDVYEEITGEPVMNEEYTPQSAIPDTLRQDEGLRLAAYDDTLGNRTVGIGFNMDSGIADKVWKRAGIDVPLKEVYNGRAGITNAQAEALANTSYQIAMEDAVSLFPEIGKYTPARQEAILNMSYQMGKPKLAEFSGMQSAIEQGKWTTAARHLLKSDYAKQTPERAQRIARAFING
jgi:GH24 family phage-related lysozyme (muramidase)